MKNLLVALLLILVLPAAVLAESGIAIKPTAKDKCPVCGMFVAKYPDFIAVISFNDGSYVAFDGPKDMFKYVLQMEKYEPARRNKHIRFASVTEYYSMGPVDAFSSYYVVGSDVYGPMGKELIPFDQEAKAQEFLKDHKGQSILRFREVSFSLLKGLE